MKNYLIKYLSKDETGCRYDFIEAENKNEVWERYESKALYIYEVIELDECKRRRWLVVSTLGRSSVVTTQIDARLEEEARAIFRNDHSDNYIILGVVDLEPEWL